MFEIIPNWHPIFVNFTTALLTTATLLFVIVLAAGRSRAQSPVIGGLETAANWNLWIGVAVTVITVAAGLQAEGSVAHDEAAHEAMENHEFWAFATAGTFAVLAVWNALRVRRHARVGGAFVALLLAGLFALVGTGHRGADLVFDHGVGVRALPDVSGEHEHGGEADDSHEGEEGGGDRANDGGPAALSPAEAEVVAALQAYHDALTTGEAAAAERYVLADERFVMIEGTHVNQGWADYRDNHLEGELADLAKVRFRLSAYRVQLDGASAYVAFRYNVLPKTGPAMDFGSGRGTAILVRTGEGWKLQHLHTS